MRNASKLLHLWNPLKTSIRNYYPYPRAFNDYLKNLPYTEITKLPNGLTIATESRQCYNVCVGLFIDAGSRYESMYNNGIAHFFEHVAFKGTTTRSKAVLEAQMACTGAHFKCFTTREMAVYYAECLCEDVAVVTDILTDCVFNNCLATEEIERQKDVVYTEMQEQDQDINVLLYDYLHASAFQGTPLAQSTVGPSINLYNFCASTIKRYVEKFFNPFRTVLVAVGGVNHEQMVHLAELYLSKLDTPKCLDADVYRFSGSQVIYRNDDMPMANVAMAVEGPCFCDSDNVTMKVAAAMIGGWDRSQYSSMDHAHLVARASYVSHNAAAYKSFNINYKDTGLWGTQFMAPLDDLDDIMITIQYEYLRLCTMQTPGDVTRGKNAVKCRLLTKTESATGACLDIGRWVLYNGYRPPIHERIAAIDDVSLEDIKEICTKYLYDQEIVVAAIGPTETLLDLTRTRANMYWLRW